MVFAASLLGAQQLKRLCKKKLASLSVVPLGKALKETLPPLSGRQVATTIPVLKKNYKNQIKN